MVTKQQQLEWLANKYKTWPEPGAESIGLCVAEIGKFATVNSHVITRQEWQQERDKMSSKPEVDSSWHERGELPPVGVPVELWFGGVFVYNCEFIAIRGNTYVVWDLDDDKPDCPDRMNSQFRPIRTEREKAIDEMVSIIKGSAFQDPEFTASILYDAGYRKVKP